MCAFRKPWCDSPKCVVVFIRTIFIAIPFPLLNKLGISDRKVCHTTLENIGSRLMGNGSWYYTLLFPGTRE